MNPFDGINSEPNFWLSCLLIEPDAMCRQERGDLTASYVSENGKSCPTEILETLAMFNAEGRPIWRPMHMQPMYSANPFVTREGLLNAGEGSSAVGRDGKPLDVGRDIFNRGVCLPSDNKMTAEQQDAVIRLVASCFE